MANEKDAVSKMAKAKARGRRFGYSFTTPGARAPEPQEVRIKVETIVETFRGRTSSKEVFTVQAPYSVTFNTTKVPGRWFDRTVKAWRVPIANRPALWTAIQAAFKGLPLISDNGTTTIA